MLALTATEATGRQRQRDKEREREREDWLHSQTVEMLVMEERLKTETVKLGGTHCTFSLPLLPCIRQVRT